MGSLGKGQRVEESFPGRIGVSSDFSVMFTHTLRCCAPALLRYLVPRSVTALPSCPELTKRQAQRQGWGMFCDLQFDKSICNLLLAGWFTFP